MNLRMRQRKGRVSFLQAEQETRLDKGPCCLDFTPCHAVTAKGTVLVPICPQEEPWGCFFTINWHKFSGLKQHNWGVRTDKPTIPKASLPHLAFCYYHDIWKPKCKTGGRERTKRLHCKVEVRKHTAPFHSLAITVGRSNPNHQSLANLFFPVPTWH